ncbi:MAG: MBL fold metallo-hydrolase [Treponemataceae bacterium]|nr:MAG: MBL fold metallo-hydrolase [Treponemataceae bacterium]
MQLPNVFRLTLPLPASPLKEIHPYFIHGTSGGGRNLLIDTAFNADVCEAALYAQLEAICNTPHADIMRQTDIFVTHLHVDHCGLIARLKNDENTVFASSTDRAYIDGFQNDAHWDWLSEVNAWTGSPPEHSLKPTDHVAFLNRPAQRVPITTLDDGEKIRYAQYEFEVISVSGHTPGQIGLFHEATKSFFCGDHILERISPNISAWNLADDFLTIFLENLEKIKKLQVQNLFPAHRAELFAQEVNVRIDELVLHHQNRLDEIEKQVRILGANSPQGVTAFMIAQKIEWSYGKDFFELPPQQKWFACSETLAHLQTLNFCGRIELVKPEGRLTGENGLIAKTCFFRLRGKF